MNTPMTIKELLGRCTPGPWSWYCHKEGEEFLLAGLAGQEDVLCATDTADGRVVLEFGQPENATLVARLSPDLVAEIVEALERAQRWIEREDEDFDLNDTHCALASVLRRLDGLDGREGA